MCLACMVGSQLCPLAARRVVEQECEACSHRGLQPGCSRCASHPALAPPSACCSTLYKLLRCTCLHCFKLRMAGGEVERFRRRLQVRVSGCLLAVEGWTSGLQQPQKGGGVERFRRRLQVCSMGRQAAAELLSEGRPAEAQDCPQRCCL